LTVLMADALKDPALTTTAAQSVLVVGVEEGEILVGETLVSLRGGEVPGGTFAPPSDKEVESLERMGFDETGKLRLLGFL